MADILSYTRSTNYVKSPFFCAISISLAIRILFLSVRLVRNNIFLQNFYITNYYDSHVQRGVLKGRMTRKREKVTQQRPISGLCRTRCGNFWIFLSLRFYVKSSLDSVKAVKLPFCHFRGSEFG